MTEQYYDHFIGGDWRPPATGEYFDSFNPATGRPWYRAARGNHVDVADAVVAARNAFSDGIWPRLTPTKRGKLLRRLGDLIEENAEELARKESLDNGKLLREMLGQVKTLPEYYHYFGGLADKVNGELLNTLDPAILNYTRREPLGVIGAITPWNSPLLLTTTKVAPALAAGNTVVVKPSEHTAASVLALAQLFDQAGFPPGVINIVTGYGTEAGAPLVRNPGVAKIAFTGSTATGRAIAREAGSRLAGVALELGGKSPNIVFADADLDNAATGIVAGIFAAGGQSCIAGSRVFLQDSIYDEVLAKVVDRAKSIRIGDPLEATTELGPLALREQVEKVERYVELGLREGGDLLLGGARPVGQGDGWFYQPTIFTGVENTHTICQEEIFGPVMAALRFTTEDEVVRQANDTEFGLAAGVWTSDLGRAHRMAESLECGTIWVNTYRAMSPLSPRAGFKQSGMGVENGPSVLNEYCHPKSVWVNLDQGRMEDPFVLRT
ncbi:aldehyde dehydrogenase [Amycolatopsis pithecellobii]|uniref:Aldehyde dehydrogenase family protein n=1 Tax=Amycolatopsis pithecellobii TaxID=664692 RepID=A0A6N7Z5A6_9PSEU|nr:aldehyde dehydrogenase [Amycolatopsis pithecellobii]MTD57423.1 aldehyde dehydrogenase family protein [Amycolatopsis pithecellobii]